ncbi:hypothetical protein AAG906_005657 [Vitis piasezkii]
MQDECMGALRSEKISFRVQKAKPIEALANQLNWLGNRSTNCLCLVEVWSRSVKNTLSHLVAFPSRLRFPPSWSTSDRGSLKLQVSGTLTRSRKDLQGIRKGDEEIEVTPIKVAYKGHHNSRSKRLDRASYGGTHRVINDI